ncbi:MAG: hypothetical protein JNK24_00460 [Alphaproteobacteria bacterium]|nr:hypothetical protein [Alphaproteobacteria bacterium]
MSMILSDLSFPEPILRDHDDELAGDLYDEGDAIALEDLLALAEDLTYFADHDQNYGKGRTMFACDEDILVWGLAILCETQIGRAMAYDARFEEWALEIDDLDQPHYMLDAQLRILILPRCAASYETLARSAHDRSRFLLEMARGLRAIWHSMTGVYDDRQLNIDDQILWARLRQADQDLCALKMAWELRTQGLTNFWRQLIASELGDIAIPAGDIWAEEADRDADRDADRPDRDHAIECDEGLIGGDAKNPDEFGAAKLCESFSVLVPLWLKNVTLTNMCDHHTLEAMDRRLQKSPLDVGGEKRLKVQQLFMLSDIPGEGSYLAPIAYTLLFRPEFRQLHDKLNESYLQQILEECSIPHALPIHFNDENLKRKFFPSHLDKWV